jgi:hypothetical protein
MSVTTVFEIHATDGEPIRDILADIDALPHWERELMIARIMRHEADRRAEQAAAALALQRAEDRRTSAARATREKNRAARAQPNDQ